MRTSLFISTILSENNPLTRFCRENDWNLTAQSLIDFNPIPHEILDQFDVIFYSSKRCFQYFDSQLKQSKSTVIATIGSETANYLKEYNQIPQFIGVQSGSPLEVAEEFKNWLGDRTVVFPSALHSKQTIANQIPDNQKAVISVYETTFKSQHIEPHSWYVFTSPSNLNSFLSLNTLQKDAKIIAWGETTADTCKKLGITPQHVLLESSVVSLVGFLEQSIR